MAQEEAKRVATLEAVAAVRAMVEGREDDAMMMIGGAMNPRVVALMACGMATTILKQSGLPAEQLLSHLTWSTLGSEEPPTSSAENPMGK